MNKYIVNEEFNNIRVDAFLAKQNPSKSRVYYQNAINEGKVLVNGKPVKASAKVYEGDEVEYEDLDEVPLDLLKSVFASGAKLSVCVGKVSGVSTYLATKAS